MITRNISQAKAELSALLSMVERGEEVVIARGGKPIARLVPFSSQPRKGGSLNGKIWISQDMSQKDDELEKLFYESELFPNNEG